MTAPVLIVDALRIEAESSSRSNAAPARLIHDISFSLARGEVIGLIGESGAGKSTLALAAMGYTRPGCRIASGRILFAGRNLRDMKPGELRATRGARIAYVAQSPAASFNPAKRLGQQVAETLVLHRGHTWHDAERHAARLFGDLDLPAPEYFGQRFPHQVSGGQLQRAMIAMAIACDPELLIFDEPTTALDVTTQIGVLAAIRDTLRRTQAAALYITHDLAVVAQLADRLMVLRHGELVEQGLTGEIITAPREDYTRRLLAAQNILPLPSAPLLAQATGSRDAIVAEGVSASYRGGGQVLRNVSIRVRQGETFALVGTSGSGKSTLARVLCGLLPQQQGTVHFWDEELPATLRQRSREQLRRIQLVYQMPDTALNPKQRIDRILGRVVSLHFGGRRRDVRARVTELLRMVGLPSDFAHRTPSQLSGGQKQRIGIARALAARPDVIICDEVTSSLDPIVAEDILKLLQKIQSETGTAYIFITHDIGVVRRIADKVAVLNAGEIVAQGPLTEVFSPPLHPYTEILLSSVPQMRTDWLGETLRRRPGLARETGSSLSAGTDAPEPVSTAAHAAKYAVEAAP